MKRGTKFKKVIINGTVFEKPGQITHIGLFSLRCFLMIGPDISLSGGKVLIGSPESPGAIDIFFIESFGYIFGMQKIFELRNMVISKIVDHILGDLLYLIRRQFRKYMHNIAFMFLGVPELFGLLFSVGKKLFVKVEACIGEVELFVFELLHFKDLFGTFGIFCTGIRRKEIFKFGTQVTNFVFHNVSSFAG